MTFGKILNRMDYVLLLTVIVVISFGLVTIASATYAAIPVNIEKEGADINWAALKFVIKQVVWVLIGFGFMFAIIFFTSYESWRKYWKTLYVINLLMLAAVLVVGTTVSGAQRWISLGSFVFQPSEFAKIIMIVTFATFLTHRERRLNRLIDLMPAFVFVGLPILLILIQPDLGTSLVFLAIMLGMLFMAGANPKLLAGLIGGSMLIGGGWLYAYFKYPDKIWIPLHDYQIDRLTIFIDPYRDPLGDGYHIIQSQIAIGSGGIAGKGLFNGTQNQLNFLPEQHTDFIFSVVGEEFGFIGSIVLLLLFFIIIYRGIRIAYLSKDTFGTLLAIGIVSMLIFHVLVNIGMTIGIMPVTGLPLPFFSYGGSSMLTNLIAVGILQNIYSRREKLIF
ncbi:rod shape-determining protein RodA [Peptococcaceae bacterium]|nr:rod shape-determining protein RodA [Peptococcaceae bacterium]